MQTIGNRIRKIRSKNHLTQKQLAELLYTSQGVISQWETPTKIPTIDGLIRLSKIFHVSLDYLILGK